jgi:hypothetical protein
VVYSVVPKQTDSIGAELFKEDFAIGIPIKASTCSHASLTNLIGPLFFEPE